MKFNTLEVDGEQTNVTVFFNDGRSVVATNDHPNFERIIDALERGDNDEASIHDLFDVGYAIGRQFNQLSERVDYNHGKLFLDGVEIDNALTQTIVRYYTAGQDDFQPLVAFMEKIEQNPNEHSKDHLFKWMGQHSFGICDDGDFIAYKGLHVTWDDEDNEVLVSGHHGRATVNGEVVEGQIPNGLGSVVTMPRNEVAFDPARGCSRGLHVADFSLAKTFGPKVVRVKVNPRDVVSVPTDDNWAKVRVCRYRVLDVVSEKDPGVLYVGDPERTARDVIRPEPKTKSKRGKLAKLVNRKFPKYYEQFKAADFAACPRWELRRVAHVWDVKQYRDKDEFARALAKEAKKRRRTWPED